MLSNISSPLYHGQTIFRKMDRDHPVDLHLADMGCRFFDVHNVFPEYFVISVPLFNGIIPIAIINTVYLSNLYT